MKTTGVQKSGYHKVRISAGIFLTTVIVGGLAIFAATNLDDLKAGANGNMLTALNWNMLIDHVKNHDLIIGEGLSKLDTDILRVESKVDGLSGKMSGLNLLGGMDTKLNVLNLQFSGIKNQLSGIDIKFNEFTKIEEKIDLLSGDNSVLQEIQNTLRSLKMTQGIHNNSGILAVVGKDKTIVCQRDSSYPDCTTQYIDNPDIIYGGDGLVAVVGKNKTIVCQRNSSNYPSCTTKYIDNSGIVYGGDGLIAVAGKDKIIVCQRDSSYPDCTTQYIDNPDIVYGGDGLVAVVGKNKTIVCQRNSSNYLSCTTEYILQ